MSVGLLRKMYVEGVINPPSFVLDNLCLLCYGGSIAYGCATPESDIDLIGVTIPPQSYIYPMVIHGFDPIPTFDDFQQHHIQYEDKEYDIKIYSIQRLFKLAMDGNPNILDFTSCEEQYVLFQNSTGTYLRQHAHLFFSKQCVTKYLGFAINHIKSNENRIKSGDFPASRKHLFETYGYDTKDLGHCIRALLSLKDMLIEQKYEPARHAQTIIDIRAGKYTFNQILELYQNLREEIKSLEQKSTLRDTPNKLLIRSILVDCIHNTSRDLTNESTKLLAEANS